MIENTEELKEAVGCDSIEYIPLEGGRSKHPFPTVSEGFYPEHGICHKFNKIIYTLDVCDKCEDKSVEK